MISPEPVDFRAQLNPAQYEAVTTTEGPVLVVAGAGSGKTRTLVYRVAYLVDQGVAPETILLLTFTRRAAAEMLNRAEQLVGRRCARVSGGTFHSLAHELLRFWGDRVGYPPNFGIMDRGDMEEVLGRLRKEQGLGRDDKKFPKRGTLATIISKAANKSVPLPELIETQYSHLLGYLPQMQKLAARYASYKKDGALMDFDDLLLIFERLLSENEEARVAISGRYRYVMVDEYQDTNPVQARIIGHLGGHGNVMVVGDDAQAIYSFRGASFRNIMDFPQSFPGTRVVRLEENYRSRQSILDLTNQIMARARERFDKRLFSQRHGGGRPVLKVTSTAKEQSRFISRKITDYLAEGVRLEEMAVLFRAASHSFDLEVELLRREIDFVKYGGRRFLESAHIKDLLSLLRVMANPGDVMSLTRVLLLMEGVGPKTSGRIVNWVGGSREKLPALPESGGGPKVQKALAPLAALFAKAAAKGVGLEERVDRAWEFYRPLMEAKFDDHPKRLVDVNEFLRLAGEYNSLVRFLADMALEPPNSSSPRPGGPDSGGRLTLSTVHSAKGLEWKVVFIIWAVEGRFPAMFAQNRPEELEEERRLMYVAATRAEDDLYFICPMESDGYGGLPPRVSRFLSDVPPDLLAQEKDEPEGFRFGRPPDDDAPSRLWPTGPPVVDGFGPGDRVSHPVFGLGRVVRLMDHSKIRVDFDHFGAKTLHIEYAGLKQAG